MSRILVICGQRNSGKTTWVCALVEELVGRGISVGTVKRTHHDYAVIGKDTTRHQNAGARRVALISPTGGAIYDSWDEEPALETTIAEHFADFDLVIAEGYRETSYPKVVVGDDPGANPVGLVTRVQTLTGPPELGPLREVADTIEDWLVSFAA